MSVSAGAQATCKSETSDMVLSNPASTIETSRSTQDHTELDRISETVNYLTDMMDAKLGALDQAFSTLEEEVRHQKTLLMELETPRIPSAPSTGKASEHPSRIVKDLSSKSFESELLDLAHKQEEMSAKLQKTTDNTQRFFHAIEAIVLLEERCNSLDARVEAASSAKSQPASPQRDAPAQAVTTEQLNAALRSVKEAVDTAHHASNTVLVKIEQVQHRINDECVQRCGLEEKLYQELASLGSERSLETRRIDEASDLEGVSHSIDIIQEWRGRVEKFLDDARQGWLSERTRVDDELLRVSTQVECFRVSLEKSLDIHRQAVEDRLSAELLDMARGDGVSDQLHVLRLEVEAESSTRKSAVDELSSGLQAYVARFEEAVPQLIEQCGRTESEASQSREAVTAQLDGFRHTLTESIKDSVTALCEINSRFDQESSSRIHAVDKLASDISAVADLSTKGDTRKALDEAKSSLKLLETRFDTLSIKVASPAQEIQALPEGQSISAERIGLLIQALRSDMENRFSIVEKQLGDSERQLQDAYVENFMSTFVKDTMDFRCGSLDEKLSSAEQALKKVSDHQGNIIQTLTDAVHGLEELIGADRESFKSQQRVLEDRLGQLTQLCAQLGLSKASDPSSLPKTENSAVSDERTGAVLIWDGAQQTCSDGKLVEDVDRENETSSPPKALEIVPKLDANRFALLERRCSALQDSRVASGQATNAQQPGDEGVWDTMANMQLEVRCLRETVNLQTETFRACLAACEDPGSPRDKQSSLKREIMSILHSEVSTREQLAGGLQTLLKTAKTRERSSSFDSGRGGGEGSKSVAVPVHSARISDSPARAGRVHSSETPAPAEVSYATVRSPSNPVSPRATVSPTARPKLRPHLGGMTTQGSAEHATPTPAWMSSPSSVEVSSSQLLSSTEPAKQPAQTPRGEKLKSPLEGTRARTKGGVLSGGEHSPISPVPLNSVSVSGSVASPSSSTGLSVSLRRHSPTTRTSLGVRGPFRGK